MWESIGETYECMHCGARCTERVRSCCLQAVGVGGDLPKQTSQGVGVGCLGQGVGCLGQRSGDGGGLGFMPLASSTSPKWRLPHQGTKGRGKLGYQGCPAGDLSPQHPP